MLHIFGSAFIIFFSVKTVSNGYSWSCWGETITQMSLFNQIVQELWSDRDYSKSGT